ncbi:MAG: hypothetical protein ACI3U1_02755, partial [Peptococcaceae bacterium]
MIVYEKVSRKANLGGTAGVLLQHLSQYGMSAFLFYSQDSFFSGGVFDSMENYTMMLPRYSIGTEIYSHIPEFCCPCGKTVIALGGHKAMAAAKPGLDAAIQGSGLEIL